MTRRNWNLGTGHSGVNLSVRHIVVLKVRGRFELLRGEAEIRRIGQRLLANGTLQPLT